MKETLLTCNYGPGGNVIDQEMYLQGQPCSACRQGRDRERYSLWKIETQSLNFMKASWMYFRIYHS